MSGSLVKPAYATMYLQSHVFMWPALARQQSYFEGFPVTMCVFKLDMFQEFPEHCEVDRSRRVSKFLPFEMYCHAFKRYNGNHDSHRHLNASFSQVYELSCVSSCCALDALVLSGGRRCSWSHIVWSLRPQQSWLAD